MRREEVLPFVFPEAKALEVGNVRGGSEDFAEKKTGAPQSHLFGTTGHNQGGYS